MSREEELNKEIKILCRCIEDAKKANDPRLLQMYQVWFWAAVNEVKGA